MNSGISQAYWKETDIITKNVSWQSLNTELGILRYEEALDFG